MTSPPGALQDGTYMSRAVHAPVRSLPYAVLFGDLPGNPAAVKKHDSGSRQALVMYSKAHTPTTRVQELDGLVIPSPRHQLMESYCHRFHEEVGLASCHASYPEESNGERKGR